MAPFYNNLSPALWCTSSSSINYPKFTIHTDTYVIERRGRQKSWSST